MPKNPFKTKQALEIQRLLQKLVTTKTARKLIMADILAEAGLIVNTPAGKHNWCYNREK
jgi:hypothetical protein